MSYIDKLCLNNCRFGGFAQCILKKSNFAGFDDVSPEEMRFEAYDAEKNGNIQLYVSCRSGLYFNHQFCLWRPKKSPKNEVFHSVL